MTAQEELARRIERDSICRAVQKKIDEGKADFSDTARYNDRAAELLGEVLAAYVPDMPPDERETLCKALLRQRYTDTNAMLNAVQRALDAAQGLHLAPQIADYPEERVDQAAHALADETVPAETIVRRAKSAPATIARSYHDDYIQKNAAFRSSAGLKCYINRIAAGGCCKWCTAMAGRYRYGEEPEDVYRRHDNCSCTVTYENGRQRQDVWSKRTWEVPGKDARASKLAVFSQEQAREIEAENGLTKRAGSGMISDEPRRMQSSPKFAVPKGLRESRAFRSKFNHMTDDTVLQHEYYQAAKEILRHRSGTNGEDLYLYNTRTGVWTKSTTGVLEGTPDYTPEIKKAIMDAHIGEIVSFHNHPLGMPPSDSDFNAAYDNGYGIGYTIGHDGRIFEYTPPKVKIPHSVYINRIASYKEENPDLSDFDAQLKALTELQKLFGYQFREVKGHE
jgi:hypothetical protein